MEEARSFCWVISSPSASCQDVHGPLHPSLLSSHEDYLASLQRLLELDADILCEGHFGIFRGKRAVWDFIRQFMR